MPNFELGGRMTNITYVPARGSNSSDTAVWRQTDSCAGFTVSEDCPWRSEEVDLITYIPQECLTDYTTGCMQLVSYARVESRSESIQ